MLNCIIKAFGQQLMQRPYVFFVDRDHWLCVSKTGFFHCPVWDFLLSVASDRMDKMPLGFLPKDTSSRWS